MHRVLPAGFLLKSGTGKHLLNSFVMQVVLLTFLVLKSSIYFPVHCCIHPESILSPLYCDLLYKLFC